MFTTAITLAAFCAVSVEAQERFTEPFGGVGGQQYALHCPIGAVVTGVAAKAGAYINYIAPICDGRTMSGVGGGGDVRSAFCPAGSVVKKFGIVSLRSPNHLLKALQLDCRARSNQQQKTAFVPLDTPGAYSQPLWLHADSFYPNTVVDCGAQDVIGIQGRAGVSVDAFGLICGAAGVR